MDVDYSNLDRYLQEVQASMRGYQIRVVSQCKIHPRHVIDSPGGTGKTLMGLTATFLRRPKRILILCSSNALYTWNKETTKWFPEYAKPELYNVIEGTPKQRAPKLRKDSLFYVMTFKMFMMELDNILKLNLTFDVCLIDEFHRSGLRNRDAQFTECLKKIEPTTKCIYPISGSTVSKGPPHMWSPLNLLDRKMFSSYWKFINTYCIIIDTPFGKEITGVQNTDGLRQIIAPYWSKVPKAEADAERPKLDRVVEPVQMNSVQERFYKKLDEDMWAEIESGQIITAQMGMLKTLKLRQLLVCPKILGINNIGAMIEQIADKIKDMQYDRTTIFTPFTDAMPHFETFLRDAFPKMNLITLKGGDKDFVGPRTTEFRNKGGLALVSVSFAQSFELETSQDCHFAGYDWDPENNYQCEWRVQRMTSDLTQAILAYYYTHLGTVEDIVLAKNNRKATDTRITFQDVVKYYYERKAKNAKKEN